jgi:SAM-dependent methyltransferase
MRLFQFRPRKLFAGAWEDRLSDLFDCGVDYSGRTILDAGCNMGIIAYEISKHRPASIHGIDTYRPALRLARQLFLGIEIESRFDRLDLTARHAEAKLAPEYDLVLFLSVYHHIKKQNGVAAAEGAVRRLTTRCREALIARLPPGFDAEFIDLMKGLGFAVAYDGEKKSQKSGRLVVFRPAQLGAAALRPSAGVPQAGSAA